MLGNVELEQGGWGKVQVTDGGRCGCGRDGIWRGAGVGGGVCCLMEVPEGCSCLVNVLQCTLEGVETVVGKYIRWKSVRGKETIFIIVVGGRYLSVFVWVVGSCLAVSGYEVLVGIDV